MKNGQIYGDLWCPGTDLNRHDSVKSPRILSPKPHFLQSLWNGLKRALGAAFGLFFVLGWLGSFGLMRAAQSAARQPRHTGG
jgi:hypothetical protein